MKVGGGTLDIQATVETLYQKLYKAEVPGSGLCSGQPVPTGAPPHGQAPHKYWQKLLLGRAPFLLPRGHPLPPRQKEVAGNVRWHLQGTPLLSRGKALHHHHKVLKRPAYIYSSSHINQAINLNLSLSKMTKANKHCMKFLDGIIIYFLWLGTNIRFFNSFSVIQKFPQIEFYLFLLIESLLQ